jgi:uncharacterized protein YdaU (DUF1376 family)
MSNDARYMPLYVGAYLADTAHLSTTAHGAYLLLIMNYWQRGAPLPSADRKLASIARLTDVEWASIREDLAEFFCEENGTWRHQKIDAELRRAAQKIDAAKRAGEASAQSRAQAKTSTYEQPLGVSEANHEHLSNHKVREGKEVKIEKDKALALSKKGTRLSDEWVPSWVDYNFAEGALGPFTAESELAKFKDYWKSAPNAKGVKLDWDATWRNWVRSAAERKGHSPPNRQTTVEAANEILEEMRKHERTENQGIVGDVQFVSAASGGRQAAVEYLPAPVVRIVGRGGD